MENMLIVNNRIENWVRDFKKLDREVIKEKNSAVSGAEFRKMDKKEQRSVIRSIAKNERLNYEEMKYLLGFYMFISCLTKSEKSQLYRYCIGVWKTKHA